MLNDRIGAVLALLLALTALAWVMLYAAPLSPRMLGVGLLVLAFVKVQLIISQYMELGTAILPVRVAFWLWTVGVGAMTIWTYLA